MADLTSAANQAVLASAGISASELIADDYGRCPRVARHEEANGWQAIRASSAAWAGGVCVAVMHGHHPTRGLWRILLAAARPTVAVAYLTRYRVGNGRRGLTVRSPGWRLRPPGPELAPVEADGISVPTSAFALGVHEFAPVVAIRLAATRSSAVDATRRPLRCQSDRPLGRPPTDHCDRVTRGVRSQCLRGDATRQTLVRSYPHVATHCGGLELQSFRTLYPPDEGGRVSGRTEQRRQVDVDRGDASWREHASHRDAFAGPRAPVWTDQRAGAMALPLDR